ncbi:hypothetical protein JTE90_017592 [Oedothorax gibbosus]|uniref:Uncharacterized protein n=1 Tax=Oedothorax gibbosus TaxID=931172 RepID=A0AAV6TME7_9ARAC|nr:hypothetical protein JTE90_017592 [Oedothorax gibbosus]
MFGQEDGSDYTKVAFWQVNTVLRDYLLDPCLANHPDKCFRHGIYLEVCVPLVYDLIIEKWDRFSSPMANFCMLGDLLMKTDTVFLFHLSIVRPLSPVTGDWPKSLPQP